jgi:hypothetical protein
MTEVEFSNSAQGYGENLFLKDVKSGSHALLLTGATLYNRQVERLLGAYALRGATLEAVTALVDDEIPLGRKEDPHVSILDQVYRSLCTYNDGIVRSLVHEARSVGTADAAECTRKIAEAIDTLLVLSLPWVKGKGETPPRISDVVARIVSEWAAGEDLPSDFVPLLERHAHAREIAESIWQGSAEIAPGVFELIGIPAAEMDEVVRKALADMYRADTRARVVLEKNHDRPANALRYDEALAFEQRLAAGESAEEVLAEVEEILKRRRDTGTLMTLELDRGRDREPADMLEKILQPAHYLPDRSGYRYTMLKGPQEDSFYETLQRVGFPLITHHALWLCDMSSGKARPVSLMFQAKDLQRFLGIIDSL